MNDKSKEMTIFGEALEYIQKRDSGYYFDSKKTLQLADMLLFGLLQEYRDWVIECRRQQTRVRLVKQILAGINSDKDFGRENLLEALSKIEEADNNGESGDDMEGPAEAGRGAAAE